MTSHNSIRFASDSHSLQSYYELYEKTKNPRLRELLVQQIQDMKTKCGLYVDRDH